MNMLYQEEQATISLRSFGSLLRVSGRRAKKKEAQIDQLVDELKAGNYDKLDEFEKLVDELLGDLLENIKKYAQRDENKKIDMLYEFLSDFFKYHLFDTLDNKTVKEIRGAFEKDLDTLVKDLRQERRDERTVRHGRKPIHTIFKRIFRNNRSLDRQVIRDGKKEVRLESEEDAVRKNLKQLLIVLTRDRSGLTKSQVTEMKNKAKDLLLHFAKIVLQEFESLHEAEVDVEIQEADLIAEIKAVMKKTKKNKTVHDRLQAILDKIDSYLKTDFYVARRMLYRAKALQKNARGQFVKLEPKGKIIPLITEFPSGMVVLNLQNKKLVVLNPDYLLVKHGVGGEQVGSKFNQLDTYNKLYKVLVGKLNSDKLTGGRVELQEVDTGVNVGTDSLIALDDAPRWGHKAVEDVRGNQLNVVYTEKALPSTRLLNIILVQFNPQFGMNVDKDFYVKYQKAFAEFEGVYAILTMFPGKYAPPATEQSFWSKHALLKKK